MNAPSVLPEVSKPEPTYWRLGDPMRGTRPVQITQRQFEKDKNFVTFLASRDWGKKR